MSRLYNFLVAMFLEQIANLEQVNHSLSKLGIVGIGVQQQKDAMGFKIYLHDLQQWRRRQLPGKRPASMSGSSHYATDPSNLALS